MSRPLAILVLAVANPYFMPDQTTSTGLKKIEINKGQIIQRKGDINSKIYSVQSGLLRSYLIDEKGKEHIFMFAPEGWVIADNCEPTQPCELFIDALENSVILMKGKDISQEQEVSKLVKRLEVLQKRVIMLLSAPAMDRYKHFTETYPEIVQRVPQRMIASYLGITPQALSNLRREMSGK